MNDSLHYAILSAVKSHFENALNFPAADLPSIWGFGPITPRGGASDKADCFVLHNPDIAPALPNFINVDINGDSWQIFLAPRGRRKFKLKFHGPDAGLSRRDALKAAAGAGVAAAITPHSAALASEAVLQSFTSATTVPDPSATVFICPPPASPPGALTGGDAIFNWQNLNTDRPKNVYWGTVAYVSTAAGKIKFPGDPTHTATPNAAITCAHVLHHKDGTGNLRTYRHSTGISFLATLPGWSATWPPTPPASKWPDMAAASVATSISSNPKEVRALGVLAGVQAPTLGSNLAKYGASTGLTVARDIGMVWRRLPDENGAFMLVRAVSNQFSAPGDSGAAVVHIGHGSPHNRKLAGFVLAGSAADNEQYYLPVLGFGAPLPFSELNAVEVEL